MIKHYALLSTFLIVFCTSYSVDNEKKEIAPPIIDKRSLHDKMLGALSEKSRIAHQHRKTAQENLSSLSASKKYYGPVSLLMGVLAVAGGVGSYTIYSTKIAGQDGTMAYGERFQGFARAIRFVSPENLESGTYLGTAGCTLLTVVLVWRLISNWSSEAKAEYDCLRATEVAATHNEILADLYDIVHPKPIIPTENPAQKDAQQTQAQTAPALQPEHVPNASTAVTVQVNIPTNQNNGE